MANVVHAYAQGFNVNNEAFKVEILGPGPVDTVVQLQAGYPLVNLRWQRQEDGIFTDPFMTSECEINFLDTGNAGDLIANLASAADNVWTMRVVYEGDPDTLFWCGLIMPDTLTIELGCDPNVNIRATDGFSVLKDYNVHQTGGYNAMGAVFYSIMNQLKNYADNYSSANQSVFFSPQYEVTGATNQVFKDCQFERYFENDYEWLRAVLNDLSMYIVHTNGYYYLLSIFDLAAGSFSGTWYKEASLTVVSSATLTYSTKTAQTDEGGLRRFTRPYNDVITVLAEGEGVPYTASRTGTAVALIDILPVDDFPYFNEIDGSVEIQYNGWVTKTSTASTDQDTFALYVRVGSYYWTGSEWDQNAQPCVSQVHPYYSDLAELNYDGVISIPFDELPTFVSPTVIDIVARFKEGNQLGSGGNARYTDAFVKVIVSTNGNVNYETGTNEPRLEVSHYFDESGLGGNRIYSASLSDYVNDNWEFGLEDGFLHRVRANTLKAEGVNPEEIIEAYIDQVQGPANFYNVVGRKCVPIRLEMNFERQEGTILGWKVGTI